MNNLIKQVMKEVSKDVRAPLAVRKGIVSKPTNIVETNKHTPGIRSAEEIIKREIDRVYEQTGGVQISLSENEKSVVFGAMEEYRNQDKTTERDQEVMKLIISGDFTHLRSFLLKIPTDKLNKALLGHPAFTMNTLLEALKKITELNYKTAQGQYGDKNKAKNWACVRIAEEAIKQAEEKWKQE